MKLSVRIVFCTICILHIHSGSTTWSADEKKEIQQRQRKALPGVSDRFIDDFWLIIEKYADVRFVLKSMEELMQLVGVSIKKNEKTSKIDVDGIKKFKTDFEPNRVEEQIVAVDFLKVFRSILSKQLSPDRYNGITNLVYVIFYSDATDEEMQSALNYLYGTGNTELQDFTADLPTPNATDCPQAYVRYAAVNDKLRSITDIQPSFRAKFAAIIEKFPCNSRFIIPVFLEYVINIVGRLKLLVSDDRTKISACYIKKKSDIVDGLNCSLMPDGSCGYRTVEKEKMDLKDVETILSTRLADENFRELINFVKAILFDKTPLNEVQRSLEYVFTDVAPIDCSTE